MNVSIDEKELQFLYETIAKLQTAEECKELFGDLCTYKEVEQMAQRLAAAKYLLEGDTYEEVIQKTEISSATLSRVSKCVKYGNGYKTVLGKEE